MGSGCGKLTKQCLGAQPASLNYHRAGGAMAVSDDLSEALRESEQRYRTLFEQAPVGVFLYDRALRIHEFNARFVEILRSTSDLLRGLDMHELRDRRILPTLERALAGEAALYEGPYSATTSEVQIQIALRVAPLRDAEG